jgi:hypothetical protein
MTTDIRAALERLIQVVKPEYNETDEIIAVVQAIAAARAALVEPVGEGPSAAPWSAIEPPTEDEIDELYGIAVAAQAAGTLPNDFTISLLTDGYGRDEHERRHCLAAARVALARWAHPAALPAPEPGDVGELVAYLQDHGTWLIQSGYANESIETRDLGIKVFRAATLLQQLSAPAPVVVAVSDALIKAECALADIAEGEEASVTTCNTFVWAERRCAEALAAIRPVMKLHKIRTSEWPPQPLPQAGEGES